MPANNAVPDYPLVKKLYQLIISRVDGDAIPLRSYQEKIKGLVEKGIGGFVVFGGERDRIRHFVSRMQSISEIPLFIASDVERGAGQQIRCCTLFPCQMAMAAAVDRNNPEHVRMLQSAIMAIADEVQDVGINLPLIPVLDINQNPDNPIICTRAFSDEPETVAWFGQQYIRILERGGLMSCAKHFPGHGDTSADSHISLPVINKSLRELMDTDIAPFREAILAGASSIMIGHLSIPALDNEPSTMSREIITGLLREKLGFNGLVMTDALNMHALKGIDRIPLRCIEAGADILLHPDDPEMTVRELLAGARSGEIAGELIDSAFERILRAKMNLKKFEKSKADYRKNKELSERLTDGSMTLFKSIGGILPVVDKGPIQVVLSGDNKFFESSPLRSHFEKVAAITDRIEVNDKVLIIAIFTSVAAWKGSSGIGEDEETRIHNLIGSSERSIIISFGSPYVLRHFGEADILIAAYEASDQAQHSVIKCLEGRMDFKGRLPVRIDVRQ